MKYLMDRISICESLLKRNEIEPFLKQLITVNEKWTNNVGKRSKQDEASQTVAKPELMPRKVLYVCGIGKESFTTSCCRPVDSND